MPINCRTSRYLSYSRYLEVFVKDVLAAFRFSPLHLAAFCEPYSTMWHIRYSSDDSLGFGYIHHLHYDSER